MGSFVIVFAVSAVVISVILSLLFRVRNSIPVQIFSMCLAAIIAFAFKFANPDPTTNAIRIAKFDMIWKQLKNPDTAYDDSFKVIDRVDFRDVQEGRERDMTLWLIHGNVTAANSFGAKMKSGYCVTLTTLKDDSKRFIPGRISECTRDNPTETEVALMKGFAQWDTKANHRAPASR